MDWIPDTEQRFRRQFDREDDQLVFRRNGTSTAVAVTPEEMDQAAALFRRRFRVVYPLCAMTTAAAMIVLALRGHDAMENVYPVVGVVLIAIFTVAYRWAWYGPTRLWRKRELAGSARRSADVQWDEVRSRSWLQVLGLLGLAMLFLLARLAEWPPRSAGQWILLIVPALVVLHVLWICVHKFGTRPPE